MALQIPKTEHHRLIDTIKPLLLRKEMKPNQTKQKQFIEIIIIFPNSPLEMSSPSKKFDYKVSWYLLHTSNPIISNPKACVYL